MLLLLWIVAALLSGVSCNAYFKNKYVGWHSPDFIYKIGDISNITVKEHHIQEAYSWFTENTCVNMIDYRDAPDRPIDLPIENTNNCYYLDDVFHIGECIGSRYFIIHETMHALAFFHTYNRPDWSQYLRILPNMDRYFPNWEMKATPVVGFDYGSGMQHRLIDVAVPTDDAFKSTMGQAVRFPISDAFSVNWLFNCSGHCPSQPKCLNGGHPHPRNCEKCLCNKYYTGDLCESPRNLIKLTCEEGKKQHSFSLSRPWNWTLAQQLLLLDDFLNHRDDLWDTIVAPENMQIEVEVLANSNYVYEGYTSCESYFAEVNDGDFNLVGRMFCDPKPITNRFIARSNRVGFHVEYVEEANVTISAKFTLLGCDGSLPDTTTQTTVPTTTATTTPSTTTETTTTVPPTTTTQMPTTTSTTTENPTTTTTTAPPAPDTTTMQTTTLPPITTTTKPEEFVCEY